MEGIKQFSRIEDSGGIAGSLVGFGGATPVEALSRLKAAGFNSVVNLQLEVEIGADIDAKRAAAQSAGLNFLHMPMTAMTMDPDFVAGFLQAVEDPLNQPVYIHCQSATRVAVLWMILRVLGDGWDIERAAQESGGITSSPDDAAELARYYLDTYGS